MATGTELLFVLDKSDLIKYLDPELTGEKLEEVLALEDYEFANNISSAVNRKLVETHLELVRTHLDSTATLTDSHEIILHNPPYGVTGDASEAKELFGFSIQGVSDEYGPTTFGVQLVTRYTLTWLDWATPHGGSGDPIILDESALQLIDAARQALGAVLPEILTAPLGFVQVHY